MLAAAVGPPARRIVDVGSGVGAVALALLTRWPEARADLAEIDPGLAALARENAAINGLADRVRILELDALDASARRAAGLGERRSRPRRHQSAVFRFRRGSPLSRHGARARACAGGR